MPSTILVTGASSGIGRATAMRFQQKGWNVVATMRSPEKEKELNALPNVLVTQLDVTDEASIKTAVEAGLKKFGQIDVFLNNAGYGAYGPIEATPLDHARKEFETNVIGMIAAVKAMAPHFRQRGQGMFVNMASVGGKAAFPLGALYHGSKFAVEGVTEALQYEMAAIGVTVKLIEPGMTRTNFSGRSFQFNNDKRLKEYQGIVGATMAAFEGAGKTAAEPESVAEAIFRAVTDGTTQLRYVTGRDAEELVKARKSEDDSVFTKRIRSMFGLDGAQEPKRG